MPYTPTNHPYIPGDPYSYDMKWMVKAVKDAIAEYETVNDNANAAIATANSATATAAQAVNIANNSVSQATGAKNAAQASQAAAESAADNTAASASAAETAQAAAQASQTAATEAAADAAASAESAADAAAATGIKVYDLLWDSDSGKFVADLPAGQDAIDEFCRRVAAGTCKIRINGGKGAGQLFDCLLETTIVSDIYAITLQWYRLEANQLRVYYTQSYVYLDRTPIRYDPFPDYHYDYINIDGSF